MTACLPAVVSSMLCETARILQVSADKVLIETSRKGTCGKCSMKSGCGQFLLAPEKQTLWLERTCVVAADSASSRALVPGMEMQLNMDGAALSGLALLFYLLPLGLLLLATVLASLFTTNEFWLAVSACAGLGSGFMLLPGLLRNFTRTSSCHPLLVPTGSGTAAPHFFPESFHEN